MRISDWSSDVCSSDLTYAQMAGVRRLLILGEALRLNRFRAWLTHADTRPALFNGYGPTACADPIAAHEVTHADISTAGDKPGKPPVGEEGVSPGRIRGAP